MCKKYSTFRQTAETMDVRCVRDVLIEQKTSITFCLYKLLILMESNWWHVFNVQRIFAKFSGKLYPATLWVVSLALWKIQGAFSRCENACAALNIDLHIANLPFSLSH